MRAFVSQHPPNWKRCTFILKSGKLRAFVNRLCVNDEDMRYLQKEATTLMEWRY